jgi:hypothetical protein
MPPTNHKLDDLNKRSKKWIFVSAISDIQHFDEIKSSFSPESSSFYASEVINQN